MRKKLRMFACGIISIVYMVLCLSEGALAADVKDETKKDQSFEYPELLVTPRASERLKMEAKHEPNRAFYGHVPIQLSAVATFTAGLIAYTNDSGNYKEENKNNNNTTPNTTNNNNNNNEETKKQNAKDVVKSAGLAGMGIGMGWIGATVLLSSFYQPYKSGSKEIQKLPERTKAEELTKERLAEECLTAPAELGWKLKFISLATNLAANVAILATAGEDPTKIAGGIAIGMAFIPFLFDYHWREVIDTHEEYKKKIYGPITGTILFDPNTKRMAPAINISLAVE